MSTEKCYHNVILNLFQDLLVFRRLRVDPESSSGRNDGNTYRHCEERSNPEDNMNNAG